MVTTAPQASSTPARPRRLRPYLSLLLAPRGDGVRRRSASDVVRVVLALLAVAILLVGIRGHRDLQSTITTAVHPPPFGISWLIRTIWILASVGAIALMVAVVAIARRFEILRDLAVAVAVSLATCLVSQRMLGTSGGLNIHASIPGVNEGFPIPILAAMVAASLVTLPYLSRGLQRILEFTIVLAWISGLVSGAGLPLSLTASIAIGWGSAAVAHLIFGSPTGIPAPEDVMALAVDLGVELHEVAPVDRQTWGVARFVGTKVDGTPVRISLYGRDAQESQLFAKLGRSIAYKNTSAPFTLTRTGQLEHESYLTLLAREAAPHGAPALDASGIAGPSKDALVIVTPSARRPLSEIKVAGDPVSDDELASVATVVRDLHAAGISHGAIELERLLVDEDGAGLVDYERASSQATPGALGQDVAATMVSLALVADADRSVSVCTKVFGSEAIEGALPFLQDVALPKALTSTIRKERDKALLNDLREKGATAAGVEVPKLAELRRVSWMTLVLTAGTLIGGWALIGVFLNVASSWSTLKNANIPWVIITALIAQLAYVGSAFATLGSITVSVPLFPLIMLELSNTFSGLALGSPAVLAARVRFFQRQGIDTNIAISSGVLESSASWIVKGVLFLVSIPFAIGTIHFSDLFQHSGSAKDSDILTYILIIVVVIGIGIAVFLAVPRWRKLAEAKIAPQVHETFSHFKTLAGRPAKVAEIFGGMAVAQLVTAMALGTSLHAFGEHLSLPVILVVLTIGSMLGGISPVPGGMGVVEAGMILGLKAAGIPNDQAVSAVFVQRLFTAYLPPIAGWFSLMWLRRKEYL